MQDRQSRGNLKTVPRRKHKWRQWTFHGCTSSSVLIMPWRWFDLAPKDAVADDGVDQHQREDEEACSPEHEGETGMGCCGFVDRDRERDHVRPERDRQRAERCDKDQRHHVEWCAVLATKKAARKCNRRHDADRWKDE